MKNFKIILIAFLIGITAYSIFKYVSFLQEKSDLMNALSQIKEQAAALEDEKQNLLQGLEKKKELQQQLIRENMGLRRSLRIRIEKLAQVDAELAMAEQSIKQLNSRLVSVQEEKDSLNTHLIQVTQEKDNLQTRLNSLVELKKKIREIKIQMLKTGLRIGRKSSNKNIIKGNRGFLVRNGRSTYPTKIQIEVIAAAAEGESTP